MDDLSVEAVASAKRNFAQSISEQEWNLWRHQPVTAAYLQFLHDMIEKYRETAADIVEAGYFAQHDNHQLRNPDCLRGQIVALRELHALEIKTIHLFYKEQNSD